MANNNPVEQDLIIRAKDLSSETIAKVQVAVDKLRETMANYTKEAEAGTGGTVGLRNSINDAYTAFQALTGQQKALDTFAASVERVASAPGKRDAARALRDAFKESLPDAKSQTQPQKDELKELSRLATNAAGEIGRAKKALENSSAKLKTLGIEPGEVASASIQVTESLTRIREAVVAAEKANENYAKASAAVRAADKASADEKKLLAKAASDAAKAAEKAGDELVAAAQRRSKLLIEIANEEYRNKKALDDRVHADQIKAEKENEELDKFRGLAFKRAQDAAAIKGEGDAAVKPADTESTVRSIQGIVGPAATARSTLEGLRAEVDKLSSALQVNKLKQDDARQALQLLAAAQSELQRQAGLIDQYRRQSAVFEAARANFVRYTQALEDLHNKTKNATSIDEKLKAEINSLGDSLGRATQQTQAEKAKLDELGDSLKRAGLNTESLKGEQIELELVATRLQGSLQKAGEAANPNKGATGLFGLRPYELTNLSYQVNDVVTQLASGTNVMQVLAQQGGQVFQLFDKNIFAFTKLNVAIAGTAAAVVLLVAAFNRLSEISASTRNFDARLSLVGESARISGAEMTKLVREAEHLGVAFDDGRKALVEFLDKGLNPEKFEGSIKASRQFADIMKISVPEAAKILATGLSTGYDGLLKLNEQITIFDGGAGQQLVKDFYDAGEAAKGSAAAFDLVKAKLNEASKDALTPFEQKTRDLHIAWNGFLDALVTSGPWRVVASLVSGAVTVLGTLLAAVNAVDNALDDLPKRVQRGAIEKALPGQQALLAQKKLDLEAFNDTAGRTPESGLGRSAYGRTQDEIGGIEATIKKYREFLGIKDEVTSATNQGTAASGAAAQASARELAAQSEFADRLRQETNLRFDSTLAKEAGRKQDEDAVAEFKKKRTGELGKQFGGATDLSTAPQEVQDELKRSVDEFKRERDVQRNNALNAQSRDPIRDASDQADTKFRKGSAEGQEADRRRADDQVARVRLEEANRQRVNVDSNLGEKAEKGLAELRQKLYDEYDRKRASQDKGHASSGATAAESANLLLLKLQQELDNKDKTNLDAKLRAVEEKYTALYTRLDIISRRKGADGGEIANVRAEIEVAKAREVERTNFEAREAGINKLLQERKILVEANDNAIKSGSISAEEGFAKAAKIEASLTPEIRRLTDEAIKFAKALGGANPSPAVQEAIAKFESARQSTEPGGGGKDTNPQLAAIDAAIEAAQKEAKSRDNTVKAEEELFKLHAQGLDDTEAQKKAAYDRTTASVRTQTSAALANLKAQKEAGKITDEEYATRIAIIQRLNVETNYQSEFMKKLGDTIENSVANRGTQAIEGMANAFGRLASGQEKFKNVIVDVGIIFAQFAAGVLRDIALMIIKQLILAEVSAIVAALTGGASTAAGGLVSGAGQLAGSPGARVGQAHEGGVVGGSNFPMRTVDPAWFVQAPRMHTGGIVGLQADEQATILQKGEKVMTAAQQKTAEGTSGSSSGRTNLRQVVVFDQKDLAGAMAGSHGEQVVVTHIKNNAGAIRTLLQ